MLPELLRHSDRPEVRELLDPALLDAHLPDEAVRDDAPAEEPARTARQQLVTARARELWEGDDLPALAPMGIDLDQTWGEEDDALLDDAGF